MDKEKVYHHGCKIWLHGERENPHKLFPNFAFWLPYQALSHFSQCPKIQCSEKSSIIIASNSIPFSFRGRCSALILRVKYKESSWKTIDIDAKICESKMIKLPNISVGVCSAVGIVAGLEKKIIGSMERSNHP